MSSWTSRAVLFALLVGSAWAANPELRYAFIVTRHGVRSPTWTLDRLNQYSASPWPDFGAAPGELTPHGRKLMVLMGSFYREWLGSQGLLAGSACGAAKKAYIYADTDQRTLETGRALHEGLFPGCEVAVSSLKDGKVDPLFDAVEAGTAKSDPRMARAAVAGRIGPNLNAVVDLHRAAFDTLSRVLGTAKRSLFEEKTALTEDATSVAMTGPLRIASTFTENLLLEYTNGMPGERFAWGKLDASSLREIMTLHTTYADLMRRTPYLAKARGGPLLRRAFESLDRARKSGSGTQLTILSGHDTNISNLSGILDLSWVVDSYQKDDVPPGGALIFTLWKTGAKYSVRVQFVAQTMGQMHDAQPLSLKTPPVIADLFVPGCSRPDPGYACDWDGFARLVQ